MDVIVDGERNRDYEGKDVNATSALAEISDRLRERGRGMLAVIADGQKVRPADIARLLGGKSAEDIGTLEIQTEAIGTLVESSLREMSEVIGELPIVCHGLAEVFQGESPEEGFGTFDKLAEIWREVKVRQIQIADTLGLDLGGLDLDGAPLSAMHEELNTYLSEALEALEARDCVLLGDLLEYELAPRAETESRIVALLQLRLGESSG